MTAVALLALLAPASAQDAVAVWGAYQSPSTVRLDAAPDADLAARFGSWGARLKTPPIRFFDDRLLWINGGTFAHVVPRLDGPERWVEDGRDQLFSIVYEAMLVARLSERWTLLTVLSPGLQSNLVGPLTSRDVRLQATAVLSYQLTARTSLGAGYAYATLFGVPRSFPVLQARVDGDRWRVNAVLPQELAVWGEAIDDQLSLGVRGTIQGGYFHRGFEPALAPDDVFVLFSIGGVGPAVELKRGPLTLTGEVGVSFWQRFQVYQGPNPLREFDLGPGVTGRLTAALTPKRKPAPAPSPE